MEGGGGEVQVGDKRKGYGGIEGGVSKVAMVEAGRLVDLRKGMGSGSDSDDDSGVGGE